jgi:hypothetical protein
MTDREDCLDEILKSIRDRRDRKFVEDHLDDLDERMQADDSAGSAREKYFRAAKEMLEEVALKRAVEMRAMQMDALKMRDLRTYVDAAAATERGSYALGIEARLAGVNTPFFDAKSRQGNQASVGATSLGAQKDWIGGAVDDIRRLERDDPKFAGLEKTFYSKAIEDAIFIEKVELEKQAKGRGGSPGKTRNEAALAIAKILQKWDKVKIQALNGEGAWITEHSAFGASVSHDPDKMLAAAGNLMKRLTTRESNKVAFHALWEEARQAWTAKTLPRIDARRMFGTTVDADKKLSEMFGGLVTEDHLAPAPSGGDQYFFNVARKVSAEREFVWKSAEDQLAHMREFGRFAPTDAWLNGMRYSADKYALMKAFGTKPKENFEELLAHAKNKVTGKPERRAFDKQERYLRNLYAVVSREADRPIANAWSGIVNGWMAVQRMAKLGLTPFAMLQDNVTISRELAYQGVNFFERNSGLFSGYLRGADDSAKREVADLLHTGILGRLRGVTARFDIADGVPGALAKMENIFFKINGMTAMTENKRADAERIMAYYFGKQRGKTFDELGKSEARIMQAFGIGDKEWALLNKAEWNTIQGQTYLTPDVATKLSDADVADYLKGGRSISQQAQFVAGRGAPDVLQNAPNAVEKTKAELALKLWAYYGERGNYAVIETGARERAVLYQGTQAGSPLNLALRLFMQFKQFPTAMISKVWGREIYGGEKGMGRIAGLVELAVGSTMFGMLANYLNSLAKGQDPNAQWRNQPLQALISGFTRGGAGSIYGDFLVGEWSRFGLSATATAVGPTFGQFDKLMELWSTATHPEKWKGHAAALGVRSVKENTPYANMIYTKIAVDYLIYYELMEWISPGYLDRMTSTMKTKQGIEFTLKPQTVHRQGLPAALGF